MPSYPCKWPTCTVYLPVRGYCPEHSAQGQTDQAARHRFYDEHQRNPAAKSFYASAAWQRARQLKLAVDPVCQLCMQVFADTVHHRIPLARCTEIQKTAQSNLMSLCAACHNIVEAEITRARFKGDAACS